MLRFAVRVLAVVPAFRAERTIAAVVRELGVALGAEAGPVIVVDDGSDDDTARNAEAAGALVLRHAKNLGKGEALRTGFDRALVEGADAAVSVNADGQHPVEEALRVARHPASRETLVLGVRNLARDGAPRANRFSNAFSNRFLSWFGGRKLADTQCGLRRYPLPEALGLGARAKGYAFESELLLRAARRGRPIAELPVRVVYPPVGERVSHFHPVRDPARIIYRVLQTVLLVPRAGHYLGRLALGLAVTTLAAVALSHWLLARVLSPTPVAVKAPGGAVEHVSASLERFAGSYVLRRGALLQVGLDGDPERIGFAQARLLRHEMLENEHVLLERFGAAVPYRIARTALLDLARLRYRSLDHGFSPERRREIAAGALGFQPDPYADFVPTYQRFVFLNALYDIALSFEDSPLVGCTTFVFHGPAEPEGGALLARAFDMEVDPIFNRKKAIFLVREPGAIPFASVAWPGLVGVVSGMNVEGVAVVVHGGRAGEPATHGEPVVHALRRVLEHARTTADAVRLFAEREPLVSHLVVVADAAGDAAVIERVPGRKPYVRRLPPRAGVTNHFEGPSRNDPKNLRVIAESSTRDRRARADELAARAAAPVRPSAALAMLRDRSGPGDTPLPLGDRRAIDALIATHGIIADTRTRTLWVSESPHLLGRFVAFDLERLLAPDYAPNDEALPALPADPDEATLARARAE